MTYGNYTISYGGAGYWRFYLTTDCEDSTCRGVGRSSDDCKEQIDAIEEDLNTDASWEDLYTDASGNCFSDADEGL